MPTPKPLDPNSIDWEQERSAGRRGTRSVRQSQQAHSPRIGGRAWGIGGGLFVAGLGLGIAFGSPQRETVEVERVVEVEKIVEVEQVVEVERVVEVEKVIEKLLPGVSFIRDPRSEYLGKAGENATVRNPVLPHRRDFFGPAARGVTLYIIGSLFCEAGLQLALPDVGLIVRTTAEDKVVLDQMRARLLRIQKRRGLGAVEWKRGKRNANDLLEAFGWKSVAETARPYR